MKVCIIHSIVSIGCGSKRKPLGTTGFGLFFLLPIGFFGYPFLTHCYDDSIDLAVEVSSILADIISRL